MFSTFMDQHSSKKKREETLLKKRSDVSLLESPVLRNNSSIGSPTRSVTFK